LFSFYDTFSQGADKGFIVARRGESHIWQCLFKVINESPTASL